MDGRVAELERLYEADPADPAGLDFAVIVAQVGADDDTALADLIEADGRARIRRDLPVDLDRYFAALPDLEDRADPLDAAIDMTLRSLARSGRPDRESVESLVEHHPRLESAIRDAAALSNVIWSTNRLRADLDPPPVRGLPCDFGPVMPDGTHRYLLQQLLGEGAFGQVYLAMDRQLSESEHAAMVSIKVLSPRADDGPWGRQRFIEEATKARRVDHANVVRVLDRGVSAQDEDFIVHDFIEGGDLVKWTRQLGRPLAPRLAAQLVARVARGLHAAHMAGLVHCDLKPGNIVVSRAGEPKIADFGIAIRVAEAGGYGVRGSGTPPLGNLAFISPEQFRLEEGALTFPSDIYALGGILYWLLTDELPNGDDAEAIGRTHDPETGRVEPLSPRAGRSEIDADLDAICRRAMEPRPQDRFASAADLADSLEAWLAREPIAWMRPSLAHRARLWVRRKPAMAAIIAALVVIVVGSTITLGTAWAKIRVEEQVRAASASNLKDLRAMLIKQRKEKVATELLPMIWGVEWVFGPTVLAGHVEWDKFWRIRVDLVRQLVDERRAALGEIDDYQTLTWESALGFWLITEEQHAEAAHVLEANRAAWARHLAPGDPWLQHLDLMRSCALIGTWIDATRDGDAPDRETLARAGSTLDAVREPLLALHVGTPLHHMLVEHEMLLYGPDLLDDPDRVAALVAENDERWPPK